MDQHGLNGPTPRAMQRRLTVRAVTVLVAAAALGGCSDDAGTHALGHSTAPHSVPGSVPTSGASTPPEPPVGPSTRAQDPNTLAPQLKPDAKTLFLSRGTVPNNTVSQVEVRAAATLTMTVVCSGNGQLTIRFSGSTVEPITCPSAGQVVELGAVSKGTSEFEFAGADGLTYVARVQSDRPVG